MTSSVAVAQAIDKIKFLLENGIINELEFKEKKAQIIEDFLNCESSSYETDTGEESDEYHNRPTHSEESYVSSEDSQSPPQKVGKHQEDRSESESEQPTILVSPPVKVLQNDTSVKKDPASLVARQVKTLEESLSSSHAHDRQSYSESESIQKSTNPLPPPSQPGADAIINNAVCDSAWKGDLDSVKTALKGKPVDHINRIRNNRNQSVLYCACRQGKQGVARWLLNIQGIEISTEQASNKSTPLHGACFGGHGSIVALLLLHGAKIDVKNVFGHLPFDELHNHVKPCVYAFQTKGITGTYQYLPNWNALVAVSLNSAKGLPIVKSHSGKTYYEVKVTLFGHSDLPLAPSQTLKAKWKHADGNAAPKWDETNGACNFACGNISQASITVRIEISHASHKHLAPDPCSSATFTCVPSPPGNFTARAKDTPLVNLVPTDDASITFTIDVVEMDELETKSSALDLAKTMKLNEKMLFTFCNTMRTHITEIDKRILLESQQLKRKSSTKSKKKIRITREPRGDFAVFRTPISENNWGHILYILQYMPNFAAEFMFAAKFGLSKSFDDFVRDDLVENPAWYTAHLDGGECPWLVKPDPAPVPAGKEKEDISFRFL